MDSRIPWGGKILSQFYRWGNKITEPLLCYRVDGHMHFQFLSSDNCPLSVSQKCMFSSGLSAQNTKGSKTIQDALAETVSV